MKSALTAAAAALVLTFAMGQAAQAEEGGPTVAFNIGATSDYVFRGVSQTDESPAIQGGVDVSSGQFYAGAWASNVDFGDDTKAEVDLYLGVKPEVAGWTLDIGAVAYLYPGQPDGADWDYVEAKLAASRSFGPVSVGAAVYYSPEFTGHTGTAVYGEINGGYKLADPWSVTGAVGRQEIDAGGSFDTWNLGLVWTPTSHIVVDLRYWDTSEHSYGDIYDSRAVISVKGVF
jgi:uncharacterized protein (TIGR02001 family)